VTLVDQLSAHLDRGWDLAQKGDTRGAESSARRALEIEPDSPEAHNLLGYVSALEGDCEEAIEAYQQAILLDESYVEAMLNAAELYIHPLGEHEEALAMCDQALGITDYADEIIDAMLLKFEALAAKGDLEAAAKVLRGLPEGPYENPAHAYLAGRGYFELGELDKAHELIDASLERDPHNADAYYYRGMLAEERGDRRTACASFLQTRQLELEMGVPAWAPNNEAFLMFTERAMKELDERLAAFVARAEVYIADLPGPEMVVDGVDPRSLMIVDAMLSGPEDESQPLAVTPEQTNLRIFVYALNVLRSASGPHALQASLSEALAAELEATLEDLERDLAEAGEEAPRVPASTRAAAGTQSDKGGRGRSTVKDSA
jgi:tetratricopeptide (TPR) repeat protein